MKLSYPPYLSLPVFEKIYLVVSTQIKHEKYTYTQSVAIRFFGLNVRTLRSTVHILESSFDYRETKCL